MVKERRRDVWQGFSISPKNIAAGQVSAPSMPNGHHVVLGLQASSIEFPIQPAQKSILVEIHVPPSPGRLESFDLLQGQPPVPIPVPFCQNLGMGGKVDANGAIPSGFPGIEEDPVAVDQRHGLELPSHAPQPPELLSPIQRVADQLIGSRHNQLRGLTPAPEYRRGRIASCNLGPFRSPEHPPAVLVHRNHVGAAVLVTDHDDLAVCQDRRRTVPIDVIQRSDRQSPSLTTVQFIGNQAEIPKKYDQDVSIGNRRWRSGGVDLVVPLIPVPGQRMLPDDPTCIAVESIGDQRILGGPGQEQTITGNHRRRLSRQKIRLPDDVLFRPKVDREVSIIGDTQTTRAPESRPDRGFGRFLRSNA